MSGFYGRPRALTWLLLSLLVWAACGGNLTSPASPDSDAAAVLVGAGDIGVCGSDAALATGRLLDAEPGTVFAAGDLAYNTGSAEDFLNCYDPAWGRQKSRTRPAPGNHEYVSPNAAPYFAYFGANAGMPGLGYYRYLAGAWQVYSLNSNGEAGSGAAEIQWLKNELAARPAACSLAYLHHPMFSSGPHGLMAHAAVIHDMWMELYKAGADIVISAHEHFYERFAPQTPDGVADPNYGIRQFVVGTGGAPSAPALGRVPNSEVLLRTFGILRLTLEPRSYRWEFVSADTRGVLDSGTGQCHAAAKPAQ